MAKYRGGKNASGTYQKIINQIPPHDIYIEGFLGSGAILRYKRPAEMSIGIELDPAVFRDWEAQVEYSGIVTHANFMDWLAAWRYAWADKRVFCYLDPPYLAETRRQPNAYRYEFNTPEQHTALLKAMSGLHWMVAISGYRSKLYDTMLKGWRRIDWDVILHTGDMATESLWMNYPEPWELHDYRYLGDNYRERERIAKKVRRWDARLGRMPALERYAIMSVIDRHKGAG